MIVYVIYREVDGHKLAPEAVRFTEEAALSYITGRKVDLESKVKHLQLLGTQQVKFWYKEMVVE